MMKRTILLWGAAFVMALMAVACGGTQQENSVQDSLVNQSDDVTIYYDGNGCTLIAIRDKATEQPAELFKGSYNDSLLSVLLPSGGARSAINVFEAKFAEGPTVLFDAGIGAEAGGRLMENLGAPEEIDAICLTHLHPDHIGWLLADGKAAFPSATIYLSETENASSSQWEATSPLLARWHQVKEAYAGKIVTFADNAALFDGRVQTLPAPGHTPGHTLVQIGNCLIAGDILHSQDLQLDNPDFCARYDQDPTIAVATRKQILEYVRNNHLQLCGAHCYVPFIKLN